MRRRDDAAHHLLAAARAGNQPDADFDEAHVGLARRDDARAGHGHFDAAAEGAAERRGDDRLRAEAHASSARPASPSPRLDRGSAVETAGEIRADAEIARRRCR